jgi:regulator of protease activity HflC (stomatin/prohibitin superfamily)
MVILEGEAMLNEKPAWSLPGGGMFAFLFAALIATGYALYNAAIVQSVVFVVTCVLALIAEVICLSGFVIVNPNEGKLIQLLPFASKRVVSLRVRNFETSKLKVNDLDGNPIEIAAVVVWQVVDTAEAIF